MKRVPKENSAGLHGLRQDRYRHIRFFAEAGLSSRPARVLTPEAKPVAARRSAPLDPEAAQYLAMVLCGAGVDPLDYRAAPLLRRVLPSLRSLKSRSIQEARLRLEREPERMAVAASAVLIGVTGLFRDSNVFACLDEEVLPKLAARRTPLRIWSAGCADGAELYSVAILLAQRGLLRGSTLLGTDCRQDAIGAARRGWFACSEVERLPKPIRKTFFQAEGPGWRVCDEVRQSLNWQQGNILAMPPGDEAAWDLILCRNVAIYLEATAAARLWSGLSQALVAGGILVTGKAERPDRQAGLVRWAPCVFEKGK